MPKLLQMFCVRDAPIRLLLLSHLNSYIHVFEKEELQSRVLPELLVGIKDIDDYLVSKTLRALADLIPILGATTVIGGNRGKLFTDGRPQKMQRHKRINMTGTSEASKIADTSMLFLPERLSPDGGEDRNESNLSYAEEENWSDWGAQEFELKNGNNFKLLKNDIENSKLMNFTYRSDPANSLNPLDSKEENENASQISIKIKHPKKIIISDILDLDIKHSKPMSHANDEFDFFTDMEPVIQKPQVLHVEEVTQTMNIFDVNLTNNAAEKEEDNGWAEDLNDWDIADNVVSKD